MQPRHLSAAANDETLDIAFSRVVVVLWLTLTRPLSSAFLAPPTRAAHPATMVNHALLSDWLNAQRARYALQLAPAEAAAAEPTTPAEEEREEGNEEEGEGGVADAAAARWQQRLNQLRALGVAGFQ